jgi:membrane protein YqaA with SNARE-associated domain
MDDKLKGAVEIAVAVVVILLVFSFSDRIAELQEYGYAGVFVISLLSAATIFIPAPGWAVVIAMGGILNPYLVGIFAGIGSGIGELTGYMIGNGARELSDAKLGRHKELIKKYGAGAVFVLAFIPNPLFDIAGLVAGALKIKIWKFLLACILGRMLRYILLAHIGMFVGPYIL